MHNETINLAKEAIYVLLKTSMPPLLVALLVGLIISLFQALTQIQESTLTFVPKIVAILFSILLFGNFIYINLSTLSEKIFLVISM